MRQEMLVLVLNAGSSTLKYQLLAMPLEDVVVHGAVERIGSQEVPDHRAALARMVEDLARDGVEPASVDAVGHRVVHGGPSLTAPDVVTEEVVERIRAAARLAPLHNPPALAGLEAAREHFRHALAVAVFDTGFFADLPPAAATYAIDAGTASEHGIRRYGFHGISHEYVAGAVAEHLGVPLGSLRQIVLHLGSGASAAAIDGGRPVDTSMGLTPLEGLVMGTRPGDLDAGAVIHLLRHGGLDADSLEDLLHHRSGLAGLVGLADVRDVIRAADSGDEAAGLAFDVYCRRIRKYVGAYLAVLGGADVLTFTAGVGEHSERVRATVLDGLEPLGVVLDDARNRAAGSGARVVSSDGSPVTVLVVPTDEELAIARQVYRLVRGRGAEPSEVGARRRRARGHRG